MRLEELNKDLPETPEFIHNMIQQEVARQIKETNVVPFKKKQKINWNKGRVAAASAACLLISTTAVYAGTQLYGMYINKQGNYSVQTGINATDDSATIKLPEKIHDISISAGYIPDGMAWTDEGVKLSYTNTPYQGGISIDSVLMDKQDLEATNLDKNVVESEEHTFGSYEGVYLRYNNLDNDKSFNQRIYMLCPENYRVLILYVGDDVSKEDALKFAGSLVITENDKMLDTAKMNTWSDICSEAGEVEDIVTNAKVPVHQIGDTISLKESSGEDKDGNYILTDGITVRVDDVKIADDLSLLDSEKIPDEWKNVVGADGKLVQNHLSYVKSGDGIDTLDEVVDEKNVNQKLVYTTITYTNTSNKEINHLLYHGSLMSLLKQEDGTYSVYVANETAGDGFDYYIQNSVASVADMDYFSEKDEYGNGGNYISSLKPGESITINMAWIVNEPDLENLYLNLTGCGGSYQFSEDVLDAGVVYIGK